jgi:hypothetical protein
MHYIASIYNKVIAGKHFKAAGVLASVAAALLLPFAAISPASAAGGCVGNSVCVYEHSGFGGTKVTFPITYVPGCYNLTTLSNQVSSVVNSTYQQITYYDQQWCQAGYYLNDNPSSYRTNLSFDAWTNVYYGANDQISSFYVY